MGGDLKAPAVKARGFMVMASKDPKSGNLDRVQIVKGWLDGRGKQHEKVCDVAWGGERKPDPKTGKLPPVGDTVDAVRLGMPVPEGLPVSIQERAWTSPIWYTPAG